MPRLHTDRFAGRMVTFGDERVTFDAEGMAEGIVSEEAAARARKMKHFDEVDETSDPAPEVIDSPPHNPLDDMKRPDMLALASELGLTDFSHLKNDELRAALRAAQEA